MLLEEEAGAQANASGSDDEEMKIPPKEVVEEVAVTGFLLERLKRLSEPFWRGGVSRFSGR